MPLTEEQKIEIHEEVSRLLEEWTGSAPQALDVESLTAAKKHLIEEIVVGQQRYAESHREARTLLRHQLLSEHLLSAAYANLEPAQALSAVERLQAQEWASRASMLEPLVRVVARAVEVLGSSEKALRWMNAPVRSLGDQTPMSLLASPEGMTQVEDALGRIEHGVW